MNRTSFFIENKALFGSFPDKNNIIDLENNGVKYFVDLTCKNELGIERYNEILCNNSVYIQYEIIDHNIPKNCNIRSLNKAYGGTSLLCFKTINVLYLFTRV